MSYVFPEESQRKTMTRDYIAEQKQLELNQQFLNRQKEYEQKASSPAEIDFRESASDGPIENMEELVKRQIRMRELDVPPPAETGTPVLSILPSTMPSSSLNVVELESLSQNSPNTLITTATQSNIGPKKVQWEDEDSITLRDLYREIQQMKKEIVQLILQQQPSPTTTPNSLSLRENESVENEEPIVDKTEYV